MAGTVTVNYEINGPRNAVVRLTGVSDGTPETGALKVDATKNGPLGVLVAGQTFYPGPNLKLMKVDYDIANMGVLLQWDATAPVNLLPLGPGSQDLDWCDLGGLRVPAGLAGATGSILLTTLNPVANATYSLVLHLRKNVPQS